MSSDEFRSVLSKLGISQADISKLLGVTSRAVSLWLSGERPVPGPVEGYLRVLQLLPTQLPQIELALLNQKGSNMRDGMFSMQYQGQAGSGYGTLIFEGGRVYGADSERGRYDGLYTYNDSTGRTDVTLKVTMPANVMSVFGINNPFEWSIDVTTSIDSNLDAGEVVVSSSLGPSLRASYRFLRSLPEAA